MESFNLNSCYFRIAPEDELLQAACRETGCTVNLAHILKHVLNEGASEPIETIRHHAAPTCQIPEQQDSYDRESSAN